MDHKVLGCFKSHYSLGKSILTLEKPTGKKDSYPISIFDILKTHNLDTLVLVDDNISGLLQASKVADENKIKLIFGIRFDVNDDMTIKDDPSLNRRAKYIVFAKNTEGYKALMKIWSVAARDGFYYSPCIDFKTLKKFWNDNLKLVVPFYDSFLYSNSYESHLHVPDLEFTKPTFLVEDNNLPFDEGLQAQVKKFCLDKYEVIPAQPIYYYHPEDFEAYITFRCISQKGGTKRATLENPNLDHMGSNQFNFDKWKNF